MRRVETVQIDDLHAHLLAQRFADLLVRAELLRDQQGPQPPRPRGRLLLDQGVDRVLVDDPGLHEDFAQPRRVAARPTQTRADVLFAFR